MDLDTYQAQAHAFDEKRKHPISIFGLVGEIGSIVSLFKKLLRQGGQFPSLRDELTKELGDALWYLASIASLYELKLSDIAAANLRKAEMLFKAGERTAFDLGFPQGEQLPRHFEILFVERPIGDRLKVEILINGEPLGDPLTDNAHQPDEYRYHDAFHLANAAVLGWSPVIRKLLGRKRRSDATIDEVEDGARALIVEELVTQLVFQHARKRDLFREIEAIDFGLLQEVMNLTSDFEVKACTAKQWQQAIWQGYSAFRALTEHRGGTLTVNLDEQRLSFAMPGGSIAEFEELINA